jgi:hypothetical protein
MVGPTKDQYILTAVCLAISVGSMDPTDSVNEPQLP